MNKIIDQAISYPSEVKNAAEQYIMGLYKAQWYEKNKIINPEYSYWFILERIMVKYLENCYCLPELRNLFTQNENKGIQDKIVENNIVSGLISRGYVKKNFDSLEVELSLKGKLCIYKLIDPEILTEENDFKPNKNFKNKFSNIILWLVDKGLIVSYINTERKFIRRAEDIIYCFTPFGLSQLKHIVNPKLISL